MENLNIKLLKGPTEDDWLEVKRRCLVTVGKDVRNPPTEEWRKRLIAAGHSPMRYLVFSFYIENIPSWVATHLCRHVHAQPYVKSQRNDRQEDYDRNSAPQSAPVNMIWDINCEELITVAHKRLCMQASPETREVVQKICDLALEACPELDGLLVPLCEYRNGKCTEMYPCGRY